MSEASFSEMETRLPQQLEKNNPPGFWKTVILCEVVAAAAIVLGTITGVIQRIVQGGAEVGMSVEGLVMSISGVLLVLLIASRLPGSILPLPQISAKRMLLWIASVIALLAAMVLLMDWLLERPAIPQFWVDAYAIDSPLLLFFPIVLTGPVFEEVLVRGLMFAGWSRSKLGVTGTILLTSALWAAAHAYYADPYIFGQIFVFGLLLGFARYRTGSILVPIAMHAAHNLASYLYYLYMTYMLPGSG